MGERRGRIFIALCVLAVLWIVVYWLWDAPQPPVTFAREPVAELGEPEGSSAEGSGAPSGTEPSPGPRAGVIAPRFEELEIIRSGETWESLSELAYATPDFADAIRDANPFLADLAPGRTVRIPVDPTNTRGRPIGRPEEDRGEAPGQPDIDEGSNPPAGPAIIAEHTVVLGEVFGGIARRYYGSSRDWRVIYEFNRERIGLRRETDIRPGDVLLIPEAPKER